MPCRQSTEWGTLIVLFVFLMVSVSSLSQITTGRPWERDHRHDHWLSKGRAVTREHACFALLNSMWPHWHQFSRSVVSWLCATLWTAARQASLSITNSWSSLRLMFIESVMPSNHLILCHPLLLPPSSSPASRSFQMSQFYTSGGQIIGVSASTSVLPMNIQDWFPWGWSVWNSLQSKGLSRVFSNTTDEKHQFFGTQLSL